MAEIQFPFLGLLVYAGLETRLVMVTRHVALFAEAVSLVLSLSQIIIKN